MFFCTTCRPKVTEALKFFNDMQDKLNSFDENLKKLEVDMQTMQKDLVTRVAKLEIQIKQNLEENKQLRGHVL